MKCIPTVPQDEVPIARVSDMRTFGKSQLWKHSQELTSQLLFCILLQGWVDVLYLRTHRVMETNDANELNILDVLRW